MKIGLFAIGVGAGARPAAIGEVARHAERLGFATLWAGEHVVLFDQHESKYPYSENGRFAVGADHDWLDPLLTLTYAAAATSRIRLATGISLVPEHNPLILAKQVASLDCLSGGRFALGVGIGWLAEEFHALGIPFERRAQRTREYIDVMRKLWSEDRSSFAGEFVSFKDVRAYPKPPQRDRIPIIFGGESMPALRRVAEYGTGWHGFNLNPDEAAAKIGKLRELLAAKQRRLKDIEVIVSPYTQQIAREDLARYRDAGVDEVVLLSGVGEDAADTASRLERMAREWVAPAAALA